MKRCTTVLLVTAAVWGICVTGCAGSQAAPTVPDTSAAADQSQAAASQAVTQAVMPQADTQAAFQTSIQAAPASESGEATTAFAGETGVSLSGQITIEDAKKAALNRVPGAGDSNIWIKTDWEDGRMVYEGEIRYGASEYEFEIDASNGTFLEWDEEPAFDD